MLSLPERLVIVSINCITVRYTSNWLGSAHEQFQQQKPFYVTICSFARLMYNLPPHPDCEQSSCNNWWPWCSTKRLNTIVVHLWQVMVWCGTVWLVRCWHTWCRDGKILSFPQTRHPDPHHCCWCHFYRTQVSLGSDLWVLISVRQTRLCWDLTDVTLADEDSNSIPTDDVNRAIPGNVAMQVAPHNGQICN